MGENFIFDKLSALNHVYHQSLSPVEESTIPVQDVQFAAIKTRLYPHQANMVRAMYAHRERLTRGFLSDNQAINGKLGIIADGPGTGKTLSVLAYLAGYSDSFPSMTCELTSQSTKFFYSHDMFQVSETNTTNLIIVPHALFSQWRKEIIQHTQMKYYAIETRRQLRGEECTRTILESDIVLTTNKCYKHVQEYATEHNIQWNNIVIDEASAIYMTSSDPPLRFQFLWLVTSNWIPLLFKNPTMSKNDLYHLRDRVQIHPDLRAWLLENEIVHYESHLVSSAFLKDYLPFYHKKKYYLVLRNSNAACQASMPLPASITEHHACRPNVSLYSLGTYFQARNKTPTIPVERVPYIMQALCIPAMSLQEFVSQQDANIKERVQQKAKEHDCMICLDKAEYPTIVNCCYNLYCGRCLLTNTILNKKCPTCRDMLGVDNLCYITDVSATTQTPITIPTKSKMETCLEALQANRDKKIIVYTAFDNIYYQMFEELDKMGIKAERIESNLFSLLKTIKNFQEGPTNVLFVSNVDLIRGFSLTATSLLIFYHELSSSEWKQILCHSAQRLGRDQPLRVLHLHSEIQV